MPTWTKPGRTESADITNENLQGRVYFSDAAAKPPKALRTVVQITARQGDATIQRNVDRSLDDSSLSAGDKTKFKQLWAQIRDDALAADGWTAQ